MRFLPLALMNLLLFAHLTWAQIPVSSPGNSPTKTGFQEYVDPANGVSFRYPASWLLNQGVGAYFMPVILAKSNPAPECDPYYKPTAYVALVGRDAKEGPYRDTNFYNGWFLYRIAPELDGIQCYREAAAPLLDGSNETDNWKLNWRTIDGVRFRRGTGTNQGLCNETTEDFYATFHAGHCYLFEKQINTNCSGTGHRDMTPGELDGINQQFDSVMLSVRFTSDGSSANNLSGVQMVGPETALVWAENARAFRMWRVHLGTEPQWTEIPAPEELSAFKRALNPVDERDSSYIKVDVEAGMVRLLWLQHSDCEDKEWERLQMSATIPCKFTLYQAASQLSSLLAHNRAAWRVTQSPLENSPIQPLLTVSQVGMVGSQHGWMLLESASQMNRAQEKLVTTSDGGRQWIEQTATGMPIGNDFPQLLIPRSSDEAWFLSSQPFGMWSTADNGKSWSNDTAFSATFPFPWCKNCSEVLSGIASVGPAWIAPPHQGRPCLDIALDFNRDLDSIASKIPAGQSVARYCLTGNGRAWMAPTRLPIAGGGDRNHVAGLTAFANQQLAFASVTVAPAYTSTVYETTDGGATWHEAELGAAGSDVRVEQASAEGKNVLLLLESWKNGDKKLMYSPDSGATWTELELPHSDAATNNVQGASAGAMRTTIQVQVPQRLNIVRSPGNVTVGVDPSSLVSTEVVVNGNLAIGVMKELRVYPANSPRPSNPDSVGVSSGTGFTSDTEFLNAQDRNFPVPGEPFVIEMDLKIFETPIPPQHMWYPMIGTNYRVLWQRTIRQTIE
jgi:hypothetical protein